MFRNHIAVRRGVYPLTSAAASELLHASAVAINGGGVLLLGPSGSGKSDLALRLIDRGAMLVSDDGVWVRAGNPFPLLQTAPNIAGLIEMRGIGIVEMPFVDCVPLLLVVQLGVDIERLPTEGKTMKIAGSQVRSMALLAFEASAPLKVEQALRS
jgi:HPr kinase/phosphorylase